MNEKSERRVILQLTRTFLMVRALCYFVLGPCLSLLFHSATYADVSLNPY